MTGLELKYLKEAVESSWISSVGPLVTRFERDFSRFCGSRYGVSTNSGTTALHLALAALRIGPGDEVILPTFTMIACANAISYVGAKPVLVDSDVDTWTMDPSKLRRRVTSRTKAIMAVHTYGHPVDMDPILELAEKHDLRVVEDAAEAHGAKYKGKMAGSIGDVGCFSFYSNKIITTGEGGMNVTRIRPLAERMAWLRGHAFGRRGKHFWHEELGFGYRMSALQAAVGLAQFERIHDMIDKRIKHARQYNEELAGLDGLTLPVEREWARNVYWMYSVRVKKVRQRNKLIGWLGRRGIETRTFFYPIHRQPVYARSHVGERYPVADILSASGINLPSGNGLSEAEIGRVCDEIKRFFREN